MNKQQKIAYINDIYYRFANAKNHGNGGNWFYPKENVIAYNVKIYGGCTIEDIQINLTERQKDYYNTDMLYNHISEVETDNALFFRDDICNEYPIVTAHYAGRSGGWLEVEYDVVFDSVNENTHKDDIDQYYNDAKELEKLEGNVSSFIDKAVSSHKKYVNSNEYISNIVDGLLSDSDIADIYKMQITSISNKLQ